MKTALVLEGGAMRGMFTAGVLDVLMENDVRFDAVIGVSAGACFGCNYKSRQIGRPIRYNLRFAKDWRYCSFRSLLLTGDLYGARYCYHTLPNRLDVMDKAAYDANPTRFIVVCTDIKTGKPVYQQLDTLNDDALEWVRASASMPLVSRVVHIDGLSLLDGGISDSIPVRYAQHAGFDKIVVVQTQPVEYQKKPQSHMGLLRLALHRYPALITALAKRYRMYNKTTAYIRREETAGHLFALRPPKPLQIRQTEHDPREIRRVYDIGRESALSALDGIRNYLQAE